MSRRSIRFRLTIWYSLVLGAGLILFALAIWISMRQLLFSDVRRLLTHQIANTQAYIESELREPNVQLREELNEFSAALNPGTYLRVADGRKVVVFDSNPNFPWSSDGSRVKWNGKPYMVLVRQQVVEGKAWSFAISASLDEAETLLNRLRILLVMLIPLVVLVASIGGGWLSRRALKPVDEMTAAAKSISAANLSERLSVPRTGDELERLAETWNSVLARLEESLKRLSRFTADASHELRTPLAIIRTTAELAALRSRPAEVYRDALNQVTAESERMTRLLEDLLFLARIDAEVVEMPQCRFDLAPTVGSLCSQIRPLADAKRLLIHFDPSGESNSVIGNEAAIRRLILALLDNAVKYSRDGAEVHVRLKNTASQVSLEIIDNGPGIGESELPLIFERFYRGHDSQEAKEGSGLGLSLAAGLAERNNARIEVASQPGRGSTFRVLFQAAA
jgi:two-component system, OmpR family, heavy metal sensor histidine kinase CusS